MCNIMTIVPNPSEINRKPNEETYIALEIEHIKRNTIMHELRYREGSV